VKRLLVVDVLLAVSLTAAYGFFETRRERNYSRLIEQGEAALAAGDTYTAIESFSGAVALKGDSMLGYLRRGEAYRRRDELEAALRDLVHASTIDPTATRPLELLGDVNAALLRYDRAADRYRAYLALDDQSPRVLYKLALVQYRASRPGDAVGVLKRAISFDDRFAEAHYLLGLCLRDERKPDQALASLKKSIETAPTLLAAREELAELYGRLGRQEDRFAQLELLLELDPGPSRGVALGLALARQGLIDRAVPTLRTTAERYPDDPYVHVALGRVWLEAAQTRNDRVALSKALEALEDAVGTDDSSEAMTLFGRALLMASDEELAERMLREATTKFPVEPLAFFYLAEASERREHLDVARQALVDYRTLEGDDREPRREAALDERIADLSLRLNDAASAVTWYQKAAEAQPLDSGSLVRYAEAHWKAGNVDAARATLSKALEKDPASAAGKALAKVMR
jgi:tetratricopeptide (TPR) repeat protein